LKNKKARIIVVDDDINVCSTMSLFLRLNGYDVDVANTGKEAVEKSKTRIYDVALLDIRLPDIEGTKLLTALRQTAPKTIKIMVSRTKPTAFEFVNKNAGNNESGTN
jgi:two-component system response regulator HydG